MLNDGRRPHAVETFPRGASADRRTEVIAERHRSDLLLAILPQPLWASTVATPGLRRFRSALFQGFRSLALAPPLATLGRRYRGWQGLGSLRPPEAKMW